MELGLTNENWSWNWRLQLQACSLVALNIDRFWIAFEFQKPQVQD